MSGIFRRKVAVVTTGLVFFLTITYKYASLPTAVKPVMKTSKNSVIQTVLHQENASGEKTTLKGSILVSGEDALQESAKVCSYKSCLSCVRMSIVCA